MMRDQSRSSHLRGRATFLAGVALAVLFAGASCRKQQPVDSRSIARSTNSVVTRTAALSMDTPRLQARATEWPGPQTNLLQTPKAVERPTTNGLSGFSQAIFETQAALVRHGISAGSIDGLFGPQTRAAVRAFQQKESLPLTGALNAETLHRLGSNSSPLVTYTISADDLAHLAPLGKTWLEKSQQSRLDYETILELVAEKGQAHPNLIRRLNPGIDWADVSPGISVYVPNAEFPKPSQKAAFVRIYLGQRMLEVFDESTNLLAHFPCSIAQRVEKRPVGELHIAVMAPNPNYTFDPEVFPESAEARELNRKLVLPPGPNNPVGTVWIGLDKPGYGIHGTPRPEDVGRTESHGCFRLANWNAEFLLRLVSIGTPVIVEPFRTGGPLPVKAI